MDALEAVIAQYRDSRARRDHLHAIKCIRLAPDLETFEALLRGEKVPRSRLDPHWAKAYGLARR
jgi:hypothetical protein